jgi:hypothetical protein
MGGVTGQGAIPEYNENLKKLPPLERTKLLFENVLILVPSYDGFHFAITSLKVKPELGVAKEALHALAAETSDAAEKGLLLHVADLYAGMLKEKTIRPLSPTRGKKGADPENYKRSKPIRVQFNDEEKNARYMIGTPAIKIGKHPSRVIKSRDLSGEVRTLWDAIKLTAPKLMSIRGIEPTCPKRMNQMRWTA